MQEVDGTTGFVFRTPGEKSKLRQMGTATAVQSHDRHRHVSRIVCIQVGWCDDCKSVDGNTSAHGEH